MPKVRHHLDDLPSFLSVPLDNTCACKYIVYYELPEYGRPGAHRLGACRRQ